MRSGQLVYESKNRAKKNTDNGFLAHLIHEASTAELCFEAVAKELLEASLMMIKPVLFRVVHSSDIQNNVQLLQFLSLLNNRKTFLKKKNDAKTSTIRIDCFTYRLIPCPNDFRLCKPFC